MQNVDKQWIYKCEKQNVAIASQHINLENKNCREITFIETFTIKHSRFL